MRLFKFDKYERPSSFSRMCVRKMISSHVMMMFNKTHGPARQAAADDGQFLKWHQSPSHHAQGEIHRIPPLSVYDYWMGIQDHG